VQSKWQQLPTEAINPASLSIDKLPPSAIIDLMVDEDRKVIAAVSKEEPTAMHGPAQGEHITRAGLA
jgi:N-acetylmuramic acid 6-phosphate (MurNAc-6-P) etherase